MESLCAAENKTFEKSGVPPKIFGLKNKILAENIRLKYRNKKCDLSA
jgi:hypothetical protein